MRHGPRKRWRLAALLALQPRRARRAFVASGIAVAVAGVVLAMGPALRWAEPASLSSVRTCSGSVCVWRDHARTLDHVREVVDTLEAERPDWLATPPRWQETRIASQDAAGFYLGNPNVDDVEIADAIAQGYLAWLTCDADLDARDAIPREHWLSAQLAPPTQTPPPVSEVTQWPAQRQWSWFGSVIPTTCDRS